MANTLLAQWQSHSIVFSNESWIHKQIFQRREEFNVSDAVKDLTQHTWKIFQCSPIFKYNLDEDSITLLAADLKKALSAAGVEFSDCTVTYVPLLAFSENDDKAVQITVLGRTRKTYEALLISRGSLEEKSNVHVNLPVLLSNSSLKMSNIMNKCLEKLFDNSISPVKFSLHEQLVILLIILKNGNTKEDDDGDDVKLRFKCRDLEDTSILYNINQMHLCDLWQSICDSKPITSVNEVINMLYSELLTHFRRTFGIDLSTFYLKTIKVKKSVINLNGMVRCTVPEFFDFLLTHLTQRIMFEKRLKIL